MHTRYEKLQEYSSGRLTNSDVARVETHLLICDLCRNMLDRLEAAEAGVCGRRSRLSERPGFSAGGTERLPTSGRS